MGLLVLQIGVLILSLMLAARVLRAHPPLPQNQIALEIDSQGRRVYVNAGYTPAAASNASGPIAPAAAGSEAVRQVIGQTARRFDVDPKLVDAVVRVESGYDSRAVSSKGAQGLMQLIPATAARFGVQNPFDPAENVRGGVTYLSELLRQFDGDVPLTLAAYNAGEGAVQHYGGIPPYAETRDYVRKVTALYPTSTTMAVGDRGVNGRSRAKSSSPAAEAGPTDNAVSAAPIYQYVDERGVVHFAQ